MRCRETKLLLEHIQTCPSNQGIQKHTFAPCPTKCQGCQDARKLLSHYRRCRAEKRKKQLLAEKQSQQQQCQYQSQQQQPVTTNFCLICTLLAKHDRDVTEKMKQQMKQRRQSPIQAQPRSTKHSFYNNGRTSFSTPVATPFSSAFSTEKSGSKSISSSFTSTFTSNSNGNAIATQRLSSSLPSSYNKFFRDGDSASSTRQQQSNQKTVQFNLNNISMPPPPPRPRTSSVGSISCLLRATRTVGNAFEDDGSMASPSTSYNGVGAHANTNANATHRRRAESVDENKHRSFAVANDPTLEMELRHGGSTGGGVGQSIDSTGMNSAHSEKLPFRKRSVSCSVVYSSSTTGGNMNEYSCETIMEE